MIEGLVDLLVQFAGIQANVAVFIEEHLEFTHQRAAADRVHLHRPGARLEEGDLEAGQGATEGPGLKGKLEVDAGADGVVKHQLIGAARAHKRQWQVAAHHRIGGDRAEQAVVHQRGIAGTHQIQALGDLHARVGRAEFSEPVGAVGEGRHRQRFIQQAVLEDRVVPGIGHKALQALGGLGVGAHQTHLFEHHGVGFAPAQADVA